MKALALLIGIATLTTSAFSQRYYFAHAGDNPHTLAVETAGTEITGTLQIPVPTYGNGDFVLQVWFQNGPSARWNFTQFPTFIGYDRAWNDSFTANPLDKLITSIEEGRIFLPGRISRSHAPGAKDFVLMGNKTRGGNSPASGTNNTMTGGARPFGVLVNSVTPIEGEGLARCGNLGANERVRLYTIRLRNRNLQANNIYGDTNNEPGLIIYQTGTNPRTTTGTSSFWTQSQVRFAQGARIAVQANAQVFNAP
jgi:hypothetical protein